jgi:small-conductance mechanosensitive channel
VGKLSGSLTDVRAATAPLVVAPFVVGLAAGLAAVCGLSLLAVIGVAAAVAVAGALIAHRTVASVLAGLVLLLAQPYAPGERLRLYVPELGRVTEADVLRIGLVTTTLCTGLGVVVLPNRQLLAGAPS